VWRSAEVISWCPVVDAPDERVFPRVADRSEVGAVAAPDRKPRRIRATMRRSLVERSLRDVHGRLVRARQELAVMDEQLMVLNDAADDARIRSLVSETPLAGHEYSDVKRHADAHNKARRAIVDTIADLERRQDELLGQLVVEPR
jgi:hypothetical protein